MYNEYKDIGKGERNMRRLYILVFCVVLALCACSGAGIARPTPMPDELFMRGRISSILRNDQTITMLVEGKWEEGVVSDKASVQVDSSTQVYDALEGKESEADALQVGWSVEVIFDGAVAESYPVQGRAKAVNILARQ